MELTGILQSSYSYTSPWDPHQVLTLKSNLFNIIEADFLNATEVLTITKLPPNNGRLIR